MLVVSNTSPLINLAAIGQDELLRLLYREVLVPPAVLSEFMHLKEREPRFALAVLPSCVQVRPLSPEAARQRRDLAALLDDGEAEALALASDLRADLVLIDERAGNRVARRLRLRPQGLAGVLLEAKTFGHLLAVAPLLEQLEREAGFWLGSRLRAEVLRLAGELPA